MKKGHEKNEIKDKPKENWLALKKDYEKSYNTAISPELYCAALENILLKHLKINLKNKP